uniref:Uncharacterized protein n=1 Tax=Daphnia galeata TaxID=27404 RepID=A0A8J2RCC6_9CRUS|nr:unnamed protein product [Daphnia galeata]
MRNASVLRKSSIDGSRATKTTRTQSSLLVFVLLAFFGGLCCDVTLADTDGYSIPVDAIRIGTEELTATRLTQHLAGLIGNDSSANSLDRRPIHSNDEERELEEQEERVGQADDDHHLPTALARLNALLRAAEEQKERLESHAATSRLLSINRGGFFRGLLVVWVPVSFLLPTLAHRPPSYYRGRSSRGRNHQLERHLDDNNIIDDGDKLPVEKTTKNGYNPQSSDYKFESHYGPLLSRLEAYFSLMKIDSIHCRWKLTCYASKEPDRYQPLSNLFRRLFERSSKSSAAKSINQQHYHPALKKFFTYVWADKKGSRFKSVEQCDIEYSMCPTPVHRLIRMDMIRFWQKLSKRFAIQLQDE